MSGYLVGILYSEFDNKAGPQLRHCYPEGVVRPEEFEVLADYVIVGQNLCDKMICVSLGEFQFLNCSFAIGDEKYHRNSLSFAFGFVLMNGVVPDPYENALRKITTTFTNLELEEDFLSNPKHREQLKQILTDTYCQLKERNEAFLPLLNNKFLAVRLNRSPLCPNKIEDYDVPMLLTQSNSSNGRNALAHLLLPWDISYQHVLPFIDGFSHVKRIASHADMDIDRVKYSLMLLVFHDCVLLSSVFRFSNVYKLTEYSTSLLLDANLWDEMRQFCALDLTPPIPLAATSAASSSSTTLTSSSATSAASNQSTSESTDGGAIAEAPPAAATAATLPSVFQILSLLLRLAPGRRLADVLVDVEPAAGGALDLRGIDIPKLLAFATSRNIVTRLHEYPTLVRTNTNTNTSINNNNNNNNNNNYGGEVSEGPADSETAMRRRVGGGEGSGYDSAPSEEIKSSSDVDTDAAAAAAVTATAASMGAGGAEDEGEGEDELRGIHIRCTHCAGSNHATRRAFTRVATRSRTFIGSRGAVQTAGTGTVGAEAAAAAGGAASSTGGGGSVYEVGGIGFGRGLGLEVGEGSCYCVGCGHSLAAVQSMLLSLRAGGEEEEHLDSLCCRFELTFEEVACQPGVVLVYK